MASTPVNKIEQYPADLVHQALEGVPEEIAEGVITRLNNLIAETQVNRELLKLRTNLAELAVAAHQNVAVDTPSRLDVITWERFTFDSSIRVLRFYNRLRDDLKSAVPSSVIEFAVCYVTQREVFDLDEEGYADELRLSGYTTDKVRSKLIDLLVQTESGVRTRVDFEKEFPNIEDFYCTLPTELNKVALALEQTMRQDLLSIGFNFPELGDDHTYGFDPVQDTFTIPDITPDMLP